MIIKAINNTAGTLTYDALNITILIGGAYIVANSILNDFTSDPNINSDISLNNLFISDTVRIYKGDEAIGFLLRSLKTLITTSVKQDSTNASLVSIDSKLASLGQKVMSGSAPIVIASDQSVIPVSMSTLPFSVHRTSNGIFTGINQSLTINTVGLNSVGVQLTGTWIGDVYAQGTIDGSTWDDLPAVQVYPVVAPVQFLSDIVSNGLYTIDCATFTTTRITVYSWNSGTANIYLTSSTAETIKRSENKAETQITRDLSSVIIGTTPTNITMAGGMYNSTPPIVANAGTGPLQTDVNGNLKIASLAQASTTVGQTGDLIQGAVTTAAPSYTTAKTYPLSLTTVGNLRVDGSSVTQPSNISQINSVTPLMGAGNTGTGSLRVTIATDQAILTNAWKSNIAQINGVTPLMGAGNGGTGSLRVNIATDQLNVPTVSPFKTRSDTFTATGNGTTIDCSIVPLKSYSIQVSATGAVTSWIVVLEGSLDNTNFTTILSHTNIVGTNVVLYSGTILSPSLYIRSRCTAVILGLGTNVIATILGVS